VSPELDLAEAKITTVIWSMGYQSAYGWIELPAFDGKGNPTHSRGVSTVPGLYFVGLPWLYTWGSGRFSGVGRDADYVVQHMLQEKRIAS
jgi:putative flavoprotein involved in K+ transport